MHMNWINHYKGLHTCDEQAFPRHIKEWAADAPPCTVSTTSFFHKIHKVDGARTGRNEREEVNVEGKGEWTKRRMRKGKVFE